MGIGRSAWIRFSVLVLAGQSGCQPDPSHLEVERSASAPVQEVSVESAAVMGSARRERARAVLEEHCGGCHRPDQPDANDRALAVFDLSQPDWAATMTDAQLRDATHRLMLDLAPGGPDGVPLDVPEGDQRLFARYVEGEIARRATER